MKKKLIVGGLLILVLLGIGFLVWRLSFHEVEVAAAKRGDLIGAFSAIGVVETDDANIAPEIMARVAEVFVLEGSSVSRHQLLARLAADDQLAAKREAEAAVHAAEAEVARIAAALNQERVASRARIDRAEASLKAATARLRDLEAGPRQQEIEQARQQVSRASAEVELATADYRRMEELHRGGAISQAQLESAHTRRVQAETSQRLAREQLALLEAGTRPEQIATARAEVEAVEAELTAAKAAAGQIAVLERSLVAAQAAKERAEAALAFADAQLAKTEIRSPIDGFVARRLLNQGDLASPGSLSFMVVDPEDIWVIAEVDEEDLAFIYRGQSVEITAEALPEPLSGVVVEIAPAAVPRALELVRAKMVRTRIQLDMPSELLRPGMEVDVSGATTIAADTLIIPVEALTENEEITVFVVEAQVAHKRKVEIGRRSFREVEVVDGLSEGDLVVVAGKLGLSSGSRVFIQEESSDER